MHQSEKSQCPSSRGGPEDSKTPPTFEVCMIISQVIGLPKKQCFDFPSLNLQSKLFWENFIFFKLPQLGPKLFKLYRLGVFWNPQDLLLMMGTEIFKIDASWAEKLTKTRVSFLAAPTVIPGKPNECEVETFAMSGNISTQHFAEELTLTDPQYSGIH